MKIVWENGQKPLKFPFFFTFFVIKDPLKKFLGHIVVQIEAKYRKDRMKTEGVYSI